ncbi:hypothetical protein BLA29_015215 [Euroglyphus maynei]|uniref:Uncharacterized protein n=1 Tax=Euroglyphus maynei TaxID=6958 RepID=A0A1Y3BCF5_EURMA|nr:hypothetical protein BLA29_015215 [Euroglyphus maynei]
MIVVMLLTKWMLLKISMKLYDNFSRFIMNIKEIHSF